MRVLISCLFVATFSLVIALSWSIEPLWASNFIQLAVEGGEQAVPVCPVDTLMGAAPNADNSGDTIIDSSNFSKFRNTLGKSDLSNYELCDVVSKVISNIRNTQFIQGENGDLVISLARLSVDRLAKMGDLNEADQLAGLVDGVSKSDNSLEKIALLQYWARLKVKLGKLEDAVSIAKRQVQFCRDIYRQNPASGLLLAESLEVEADIFTSAKMNKQARLDQAEMERLQKMPRKPSDPGSIFGTQD
jgi:hypothetical protein